MLNRLALALLVFPLRLLAAPATTTTTAPVEKTLTLSPSPITRPELRYHLLPTYGELKPGNAATLYLLAETYGVPHGGDWDKLANWIQAPPSQIPRPLADELCGFTSGSQHTIDLAARREDCKWEFSYREDGVNTLLPHLSDIRHHASRTALRARLQIIDHKWDDAAHTLQTGFALVYHLNHDAVIVQDMVAAGVARLMLDQVDLWIATPGSPNLYWPLTNLPEPLIDLRGGMEREAAFADFSLPHFTDARAGKLTPENLAELTGAFNKFVDSLTEDRKSPWAATQQSLALTQGKQWLIDQGRAAADLDKLEPSQLTGLVIAESYDDAIQSLLKWSALPYWQAADGFRAADEKLKKSDLNVVARMLIPAMPRMALSAALPQRHLEELRTLEAIRAYAAAHGGNHPATLDDLRDLPLPIDPITGKPFGYKVTVGGFQLAAPTPAAGNDINGAGYSATFRK